MAFGDPVPIHDQPPMSEIASPVGPTINAGIF
jgi:hypothetical protein